MNVLLPTGEREICVHLLPLRNCFNSFQASQCMLLFAQSGGVVHELSVRVQSFSLRLIASLDEFYRKHLAAFWEGVVFAD